MALASRWWLTAGLSQQLTGFNPRLIYMGFVEDEVVLMVFSENLISVPSVIIPTVSHNRVT